MLASRPSPIVPNPPLSPRVFSLPAGAPFLATLARALLAGELIPGFPSGGALDLARATIYVPTQRAGAALAREIVAASGKTSLILPRIAPLGAFEPQTDFTAFEHPHTPRLEARPAVGELTRRLTLARLTRAWGEALRGAIRRVDAHGRIAFDESEPPLVASGPAQAFALAGDLAALIDAMIIEGVAWERLDGLVADTFDPYWRITLDFLKIAVSAWPQWLAEHDLVDRATRAAMAVEREIEALGAGVSRGPTIIAGSTGTNRATARLIGAIARAGDGAVVLPDLDQELDDDSWAMIGAVDEENAGAVAGHPQAALWRLLDQIGVAREDVTQLGAPPAPLRARARFLSEALRPAESTHFWRRKRDDLGEASISDALAEVTLILADNENEEALALAVAMRSALETAGKTAALITPDPAIGRRVAAELARWGIEIENSAGRALGDTPGGVFARLALAAARDFTPLSLAALLGHSLMRLGRAPDLLAAEARALELSVLRAILPPQGLDDIEAAFAAAHAAAKSRHAHPALRSLGTRELRGAETLLRDLAAALAPLRGLPQNAPLGDCLAVHRTALGALAAPDEAGAIDALDALFDETSDAAPDSFLLGLADYAALFDQLLAGQRAPLEPGGHPRLAILGLLEARLLSFDLTLLAGLDETVWPPAAETDAFLNRPMRAKLGLSAPERRIGQTAHDFTAALGAREAVLSRAKKRGGSPTVASRFLQRIGAVAGEPAMARIEAQGDHWLRLARALDRPDASLPIRRPEPRPKLDLRPKQLSVTRIEALRRDPYAIYAESILRLQPLAPIGAEAGPAEIGDVWHDALQKFTESLVVELSSEEARERLMAIARAAFAPLLADPAFHALRWPRIVEGLGAFLDFDRERRELARAIWVEKAGRLEIPLADGSRFTLTARADRIEHLREGGAAVIDYKTGVPPGLAEVQVGFAPQLTLEAAMAERGGFAEIPPVPVIEAIYLKLGGVDGGFTRALRFKDAAFAEVVASHFSGLKELLEQFAKESTPYLSRPHPKFAGRGADYDHLARVKEWSATGGLAAAAGDAP
jgi:ATP-dependent helicase/nuclease subunit B